MNNTEARQQTVPELYKHMRTVEQEAFRLRMQQGAGQQVKNHRFKELRRERARIRTIINEKTREQS